jgi:hypothetical protein
MPSCRGSRIETTKAAENTWDKWLSQRDDGYSRWNKTRNCEELVQMWEWTKTTGLGYSHTDQVFDDLRQPTGSNTGSTTAANRGDVTVRNATTLTAGMKNKVEIRSVVHLECLHTR